MKQPVLQREMKTLRANRSLRLLDIAKALNIAPAYLCAIEIGERPAPLGFVEKIQKIMSLSARERERLDTAIKQSIQIFRLDEIPLERREPLSAIFSTLLFSTDDELEKISRELKIKKLDWLPSKKLLRHDKLAPSLGRPRIEQIARTLLDELQIECTAEIDIIRVLEGRAFQKKYPKFRLVILENGPIVKAATWPSHEIIFAREAVYEKACDGDARSRHIFAHELGHLVLHKQARLRNQVRSAYRAIRTGRFESAEQQADDFADFLLVPAASVHGWDDAVSLSNRMNVQDTVADRRLRFHNKPHQSSL